jgi:hypothetical protein
VTDEFVPLGGLLESLHGAPCKASPMVPGSSPSANTIHRER